jgi:hypothetical protein
MFILCGSVGESGGDPPGEKLSFCICICLTIRFKKFDFSEKFYDVYLLFADYPDNCP